MTLPLYIQSGSIALDGAYYVEQMGESALFELNAPFGKCLFTPFQMNLVIRNQSAAPISVTIPKGLFEPAVWLHNQDGGVTVLEVEMGGMHQHMTYDISPENSIALSYHFTIPQSRKHIIQPNITKLHTKLNLAEFKRLNCDVLDKITLHESYFRIENGYNTPPNNFKWFSMLLIGSLLLVGVYASLHKPEFHA